MEGVGEKTFDALVGAHGRASAVLDAARTGTLRREHGRSSAHDVRAIASAHDARGRVQLAPRSAHGPSPLLREEVIDAIEGAARSPERVHERTRDLGLWTWTPLDAKWPHRLRVLDPPPRVLFGWGDRALLEAERSIAVVGTRRPTLHGRSFATRLGARLVALGATIVSGLAIGIDGAAQAAAVEHGGRTVGVLGSGHAHAGPRAHRELIRRLLDRGAVISEMAPDSIPTRGTFPRRNRIISALGDAVIVVEAPARSGALITARHALEQGRELFVVPGRPDDRASAGCLALLRETPARVVAGIDELVVDLGLTAPAAGARPDARATPASTSGVRTSRPLGRNDALALLGSAERAVAAAICNEPRGLDGLVTTTGMSPGVVAGAITLLQLRGWILPSGSGYLPAGPLVVTS